MTLRFPCGIAPVRLKSAAAPVKRPLIIPIFLPQMGCPHQCLFCNQTRITGRPGQLPSTESVTRQIEQFLAYSRMPRSGVEVSFYGGNFLGLEAEQITTLLSIVLPFIHAGDVNGIRFSTRPDTIDARRLALIAPFPITTVELGVQSMSDKVLAMAARGHTVSDTLNAMALLQQTSYQIGHQVMIGLPGETSEELMESAHRIAALIPNFVRIYPTLVLEGSKLAHLHRSGKYLPLSLSQAVTYAKDLFLLFQKQRIPVIRMGLQASEDLDQGGAVLAGPYHPAFGHLVFSSIYLDAMRRLLSRKPLHVSQVTIFANAKEISRARGLKNQNLTILNKDFNLSELKVLPDSDLPAGTLSMENVEIESVFHENHPTW